MLVKKHRDLGYKVEKCNLLSRSIKITVYRKLYESFANFSELAKIIFIFVMMLTT